MATHLILDWEFRGLVHGVAKSWTPTEQLSLFHYRGSRDQASVRLGEVLSHAWGSDMYSRRICIYSLITSLKLLCEEKWYRGQCEWLVEDRKSGSAPYLAQTSGNIWRWRSVHVFEIQQHTVTNDSRSSGCNRKMKFGKEPLDQGQQEKLREEKGYKLNCAWMIDKISGGWMEAEGRTFGACRVVWADEWGRGSKGLFWACD